MTQGFFFLAGEDVFCVEKYIGIIRLEAVRKISELFCLQKF